MHLRVLFKMESTYVYMYWKSIAKGTDIYYISVNEFSIQSSLILPTGKGEDEHECATVDGCRCHVFCFVYTR